MCAMISREEIWEQNAFLQTIPVSEQILGAGEATPSRGGIYSRSSRKWQGIYNHTEANFVNIQVAELDYTRDVS